MSTTIEKINAKILDSKLYENIVEKLKDVDTSKIDDSFYKEGVDIETIEEQKVYFWIRLYIENEDLDIQPNDELLMEYLWAPGEKLSTKFICYGKKGLQKDHEDELVGYNPEDDKKIICLLVDSNIVNYSDNIPFLRKLFKTSFHYEEEIIQRSSLTFTSQRTGEKVGYFDCDF